MICLPDRSSDSLSARCISRAFFPSCKLWISSFQHQYSSTPSLVGIPPFKRCTSSQAPDSQEKTHDQDDDHRNLFSTDGSRSPNDGSLVFLSPCRSPSEIAQINRRCHLNRSLYCADWNFGWFSPQDLFCEDRKRLLIRLLSPNRCMHYWISSSQIGACFHLLLLALDERRDLGSWLCGFRPNHRSVRDSHRSPLVAEEYEKFKAKEQAKVKEKDKPQARTAKETKDALMTSKSDLEKDGVPKDEEMMLLTRHGTPHEVQHDSRSNPLQGGEDDGGPSYNEQGPRRANKEPPWNHPSQVQTRSMQNKRRARAL